MFKLVQTYWPAASQLYLLLLTFAAYLGSILVFGLAYYILYSKKHTRFFVQWDIAAFQANTMIRETEARIHRFGSEIQALEELQSAVSEGAELPTTLTSGRRAETNRSSGQLAGNIDEAMCLRITTADGREVCSLQRTTEHLNREYLIQC